MKFGAMQVGLDGLEKGSLRALKVAHVMEGSVKVAVRHIVIRVALDCREKGSLSALQVAHVVEGCAEVAEREGIIRSTLIALRKAAIARCRSLMSWRSAPVL